jgi:hypothetical protein
MFLKKVILIVLLMKSFSAHADDNCVYKSNIALAQYHGEKKMNCMFPTMSLSSYMEKLKECDNGRRLELYVDSVGTLHVMYLKESSSRFGSERQFKLDLITKDNQTFSCYYY